MMKFRNMALKYYGYQQEAGNDGGEGGGGEGSKNQPDITKTPEFQAALDASVSGLKAKNGELLGEQKKFKEQLSKFDGIDPDTVRTLLNQFASSEEAKLIAEGKIEEVLDIRSSFAEIANLVRYRDVYSTNTIGSERLKQLLDISIKVAAGTPTIEWEPAQYEWTLQNPELAASTIGTQLGKARFAHMLNTGLLAGVAAISGNAAMVYGDGTEDVSFKALNRGASKMGDRSASLRVWALHSATMHHLFENSLTNTENLFSYDTVNVVRDPFGRLFVITDSPSLVDNTGANPVYKTLGLVESSIVISDNADFNSVIVPVLGRENIGAEFQAEWSYNTGVNGYACPYR